MSNPADFYQRVYQETQYSKDDTADKHPFAPTLRRFLEKYDLAKARCVEIGSGRGAFQDLVADYTGVDYSTSVARYYRKPFFNAACEQLPFPDHSFDVAWSYAVLEHVDDPQRALEEIRRILKPGGLLLLEPAWQCRPWAADGYPVRPYSDFGLGGKLIKASIPLRDSVLFRSSYLFPRRLSRLPGYLLRGGRPVPFRYGRLKANFEKFWVSDSDAQNNMDPFDALLFFNSRGDECLNYPTLLRQFLIRTGPLVIRIRH